LRKITKSENPLGGDGPVVDKDIEDPAAAKGDLPNQLAVFRRIPQ
jgi:hypothetical protein